MSIEIDEAKLKLEEEKKARVIECGKELQAILEKHNCILDCVMILKTNSVIPQIIITAKD